MVKCETIAVTDKQAAALRAAARVRLKCARSRGAKHLTFGDYFKGVRGKVPNRTDADTTCAEHRLVRVACGLRQKAHITHKAKGNVHFKKGTALAKAHPVGVRCYAPPALEPSGGTYPSLQDQNWAFHSAYGRLYNARVEHTAAKKRRHDFDNDEGWKSSDHNVIGDLLTRREPLLIEVDAYDKKEQAARFIHDKATDAYNKHLRALQRRRLTF